MGHSETQSLFDVSLLSCIAGQQQLSCAKEDGKKQVAYDQLFELDAVI